MAATGIISGAMQAKTDPNAPQSGQEASASAIGAATPASAPLGSASQSSTIAPAPSTSGASSQSGTGGAQSYLDQLNAAAGNSPSPSPAPAASQAPSPSPVPTPAPAPSGIIASARQKSQNLPSSGVGATQGAQPSTIPNEDGYGNTSPAPSAVATPAPPKIAAPAASPAPAPAATPTASPAPISPLLTQPADYSKPESQAEIDAYNQLAVQAGKTGDYSQLDSIGANDQRNIFGATYAPGDKSNPAFITAQMSGKSTDGIPQWLTPQQVQSGIYSVGGADAANQAQARPGIIASQKAAAQAPAATAAPVSTAAGAQTAATGRPATAADINQAFINNFGRPAAANGLQFYQQMLAQNPNMTVDQLNSIIRNGAQSQDLAAENSLNGGGSLGTNWTNPLLNPSNVQSATTNPNGQDVWDAATNSWTTKSGVAQGPENANGIQTEASTYSPYMLSNPSMVDVNAPQTVAGQLANLENPNSPLIQAARTQALQQANASGLLNSTMAITAGDAAAYNAALPVAEQDATTYNNDAVTNAAARNQFAVDNQNAINSGYQFNAGAQNTLTGQKMTQAMSASSTAQQAGTVYANWLNQIQQSTMDANAKNAAEVQAYNTYLQQMQALAGTGLPDVSGLLQFPGIDPNTGLPDYRDPATGLYSSTSSAPGATPAPISAPTPTPTPTPTSNNPRQ